MTDKIERKWPARLLRGNPRNWSLDWFHHGRRHAEDRESDGQSMHRPGQEWLMGLIVPPFQRPSVWVREQQIRFVESAVVGLPLGMIIYNDTATRFPTEKVGDKFYFHRTDRWLIDGQQRLRALDAFFGDQFPVFGCFWSEVPMAEQRRFLMTPLDGYETEIADEAQLRELYDRLNYGGTPHTPEQRAVREGEARAIPSSEDYAAPQP